MPNAVKHRRLNFVDPRMHATTNHVESLRSRAKIQRNECGTYRTLIDTYLIESMWRQKFGKDPYENLLEHIHMSYPVE